MRISILIFCFLLFQTFKVNCQKGNYIKKFNPKQNKWFISSGINYNVPLNEFGVNLSYSYELNKHLFVGANITYFPGIREVKDFYGGIFGKYLIQKSERKLTKVFGVYESNKLDLYVIGSLEENWWINNNTTSFIPFLGFGSSRGKKYFKYYAEAKYNTLYNEIWFKSGITMNVPDMKKQKLNHRIKIKDHK